MTNAQQSYKHFFSLNEQEEKTLQQALAKIDLKPIIDRFYKEFTVHPIVGSFFKGADINALKQKQYEHWMSLLSKDTRLKALDHAAYIGNVHERIGIKPDFYLSGYSLVFEELLFQLTQTCPLFTGKQKRKEILSAISKLLMADISASLVAYVDKSGINAAKSGQKDVALGVIDSAVDTSMAINHLFIDSLKISQMASEVDHRVNSISAAIEEMSATTSLINENTNQALEYTSKTSMSAREGRVVSDKAVETMNTISMTVEETTEKANLLAESSKQIEGIITQIHNIAEQTNLLALNATIEAARAGEAGKGFAVVANEVKSLSNATSKSTNEISEIINHVVMAIQDIVAAMNRVKESVGVGNEVTDSVKTRMQEIEQNAQLVGDRMQEISGALQEQGKAVDEISRASTDILESSSKNKEMSGQNADLSRETSEKVAGLIQNMTHLTDESGRVIVKLAKSDHIIWKRKLADMMLGNSGLTEAELKDHTMCRLGQWYYGSGQQECSRFPAYRDLEEPHKHVHALGKEIFALYKQEQHKEALNKLSEMEAFSTEVVFLLDKLDQEMQAIQE